MIALRDRMRRMAMAALIISHGTPMILMGDEVGHSQKGNNNAYCQDGPLTWMDWAPDNTCAEAFRAFVAGALGLRHELPLLRSRRYLHGDPVGADQQPDVRWLRSDGGDTTSGDWANRATRTSRWSCAMIPAARCC